VTCRRHLLLAFVVIVLFDRFLLAADFISKALSPTWISFMPAKDDEAIVYGVSAIVEHEGAIWFGTESHGLWRYQDSKFEDLSQHLHARHVRGIVETQDGGLCVVYDMWGGHGAGSASDHDGVACYRDGTWHQFDLPEDILKGYARQLGKLFHTRDDSLWFITLGRLLRFRSGMWSLMDSVADPRELLEAADGTVWLTSETGNLWRFNGISFEVFRGSDGITLQNPYGLVRAPDGTIIWVDNNGLTSYMNGHLSHLDVKVTSNDERRRPRFVSRDGSIWLSAAGSYSLYNDALQPMGEGHLVSSDNAKWFFNGTWLETRDGSIWYGIRTTTDGGSDGYGGVAKYSDGLWQRFVDIAPNVVPSVKLMYEAADRTVWISLPEGYIARYSAGDWFTIRRKPPNSINERTEAVATWADASDGSLWLGMERGELRHFVGSRGTCRAQKVGGSIILTLRVTRGYTNGRDWMVKYGFSASPATPPVEYFRTQFSSTGEVSISLPESEQPTYLYAIALDPDGTSVALNGTGWMMDSVMTPNRAPVNTADEKLPAGLITQIDGRATDGALQFRGSSESFADSAYRALADGFHTCVMNVQSVSMQITMYKEKQLLKVFRPFGRSVALIIAVSGYPKESGYRQLPVAEPQAKELERFLKNNGFETIPLYGPRATKDIIINTMTRLKLGPSDRLIVYFGGHGDFESTGSEDVGYIVPVDGVKGRRSATDIRLLDLVGIYSQSILAKQVLFVFDSCQSGLAIKRGDIDRAALRRLKAYQDIKYYAQKGRMILTAGSEGEAALDVNGGVFTRAFLEGIRGRADREVGDRNGVVDFYELFSYVHREVTEAAGTRGYLQHPDFSVAGGMGRFFFIYDRSLDH
jgi:hypothetical protein